MTYYQKLLIVAVVSLLVLVVVATGVYFYIVFTNHNLIKNNNISQQTSAKLSLEKIKQEEAVQEAKAFPDNIKGMISFLDVGKNYKSVVKTSDGKEYTLSPKRPKSVYEFNGIEDGQEVVIQGKIMGSDFFIISIKPFSN